MKSIWNSVKDADMTKSLKKDLVCDIVVVGGGIAGILTAYHLSQNSQRVTLIEASTLFSGVTHNTTAHMDAMQGYKYDSIKNNSSITDATLYFNSQIKAIRDYESIIKKEKINCDFMRADSFMYTIQQKDKLQKEYQVLKDIGADVEFEQNVDMLNFPVDAAIKLSNQAHFNPIKFLNGLPKKFDIVENTRIIKVDTKNKILYTSSNKITANKIIVATGYPIIDVPGWYFLRMYKSHSYSIAIEGGNINAVYQSDMDNGLTFRPYDNKVIIGGLDHRSGRVNSNDKFTRLGEIAKRSFGEIEVTHRWSANDCITFDGVPYAGYYSKKSKDIFIITGFNKWGMTNSMACSKLISDMIAGKENDYEKLFSPQRKWFEFTPFMKNTAHTVKNLIVKPIIPPIKTPNSLQPGTGAILFYKGSKKAIYKDKDGNLYVSNALCPHLKCQLQFNPNTITWDCPCHGSRFDIYGNIIVSPAVGELNTDIVKE